MSIDILRIWLGLVGFVIGTVLGSFTKVLADRSISSKSLWGRSYCPSCKQKLSWYDLIPILSYLNLRGRCRNCSKKISIEYLLIEVLMGVLIAGVFLKIDSLVIPDLIGDPYKSVASIFNIIFESFFVTILVAVAITDIKKTLIPDVIMLPAIIIAFLAQLAFSIFKIGYLYYYLSQSLVGKLLLPPHSDYFLRHVFLISLPFLEAVLIGLLIAGFFMALILITKGKGMGGGDVKLGAFMGLGLGFPNALLAVILAFIIGAVFALGMIFLKRKHFGENIPFGPFLVLGSLIAQFFGNQIVDWYLKLSH